MRNTSEIVAHASYKVVATVNRIDKIIGLFCRISSLSKDSFAKETNFMDPTNRSHPVSMIDFLVM